LSNQKAQGCIEFEHNGINYFNRNEIIFITLDYYNKKMKTDFMNINELIFSKTSIDDEIKLRKSILSLEYDLSPIIVVENIINSKLTIELNAKTYEDTKEKLIIM